MMSTESRRRHALCALHFHSDLKKEKLYNIRYIDNILKIQTIMLQASKLIFLQYSKTFHLAINVADLLEDMNNTKKELYPLLKLHYSQIF